MGIKSPENALDTGADFPHELALFFKILHLETFFQPLKHVCTKHAAAVIECTKFFPNWKSFGKRHWENCPIAQQLGQASWGQ